MNKIFVTADTHFGHANIIRYCDRPFGSVEEMDSYMIKKWNEVVDPEDTVYHLGDFAFLPINRALFIIASLNGFLKLVPGNHDKRFLKELKKLEIEPFVILPQLVQVDIDGRDFTLCHFPLEQWEGSHKGHTIHLHGHTHGKFNSLKNRYDIGVDMYGGPVEVTPDLIHLNNPRGWNVNN